MKNVFLFIAIFLLINELKSQPPWQTGGNAIGTVNNNVNNFLGTQAGNNTPIHFGVNGHSDIWVDNLNGAPQIYAPANFLNGGHWVGMGGVFGPGQPPLAHLHITGLSTIGFAGVRTWMQTGTLYSENSDGMYSSETFYILA